MMIAEQDVLTEREPTVAAGRDKRGEPFVIRAYSPARLDALQAFYEEFEPKRRAQGLPPAGHERIRGWLASVLSKGIHLLVFREEDLIGHGLVMPTTRDGVGEYAVFLRESQRSRGIGTELTRAVVSTARQVGLRGLWLSVEPGNKAAIRSYEKAGFRFVPSTILSIEPEMELAL